VQSVAARTVGMHLAGLAASRPGGIVELAGPEVHDLPDLARRLLAARHQRLRVLGARLPGTAAKDMRAGALLATSTTTLDGPTYDAWLDTSDAGRLALGRSGAGRRT